MTVGIYTLSVEQRRRQGLLNDVSRKGRCTEGVSKFKYNRHNSLLTILSFEDGFITHIADGNMIYNNLSDSVSLVMKNMEKLKEPVEFSKLFSKIDLKLIPHLKNRIENGGLLGEKTHAAVVEALESLGSSIVKRLARLSPRRLQYISELTDRESENLVIHKYGLGTVFNLVKFPLKDIPSWSAPIDAEKFHNFLDGIEADPIAEDPYDGPKREDSFIDFDFRNIPDFDIEKDHVTHRTFIKKGNSNLKLRVFMANRYPLETQTGADLIYYNETYKNFVFVQYKMIEHDGFRWRGGDKFSEQIRDMEKLISDLSVIDSSNDSHNYRFTRNPYFLKFIPRRRFDPDDSSVAGGFYFPLEYWNKACADELFIGPRGGNIINSDDNHRYIDNHCFRSLVSNAWVGTSVEQSQALNKLIRKIMNDGRTVIYASLAEFS